MLYDIDDKTFESEKERNFYMKVFAGCVFNELVDGWKDRLATFSQLLRDKGKERGIEVKAKFTDSTHVSFDNHIFHLTNDPTRDRGEFADILIHDKDTRTLAVIEVKFLSSFTNSKDDYSNRDRLSLITKTGNFSEVIRCLLITKAKHDRSKSLHNLTTDMVVLTWDDILRCCGSNEKIKDYIHYQRKLTKKDLAFAVKNGVFSRTSKTTP